MKKLVLGVDSTGFKPAKASFYYTIVLKRGNGGKAIKRIKKIVGTSTISPIGQETKNLIQ